MRVFVARPGLPAEIFLAFNIDQGRSQTSEQDEASLERRRREPLGGSGKEHFEI